MPRFASNVTTPARLAEAICCWRGVLAVPSIDRDVCVCVCNVQAFRKYYNICIGLGWVQFGGGVASSIQAPKKTNKNLAQHVCGA